MKRYWPVFAIFIALLLPFKVGAQVNNTTGEIEDAEIIVEKNKPIILPKAEKPLPNVSPDAYKAQAPAPSAVDMVFFTPKYSPVNIEVKPRKYPEPEIGKLYGNYVKLGIGNYGSSLFDAYLSAKRSEKYDYGLIINHLSSATGPVKNSGYSDNLIKTYGGYFGKLGYIKGSAQYQRNSYRYYAFGGGDRLPNDSLRQIFNRIYFDSEWLLKTKSDIVFSGIANFKNVSASQGGSEGAFFTNYKIEKKYNDKFKPYFTGDLFISKINFDSVTKNRNAANIYTGTYFAFNNNLNLKLGIGLGFDNDKADGRKNTFFFPDIEANYNAIPNRLNLIVFMDGKVNPTNYYDLTLRLPYIDQPTFLQNQVTTFRIGTKATAKLTEKMALTSQIDYSVVNGLLTFINAPFDSARFLPLNDSGNANVLTFKLNVNYTVYENSMFGLGLVFNSYNTNKLLRAYHLPSYQINAFYKLLYREKVVIQPSLSVLGGINALSPTALTETSMPLDPIIHLNLSIDYLFSKKFSAFLSANNLLFTDNPVWYGYPTQRILGLAGITYTF